MNKKHSFIKRILSYIAIFTFINLAITLFTIGNQDFGSADTIYNMIFGAIVIIFILVKVFQKAYRNKNITITNRTKNSGLPPSVNNKPLHPK